MKVIGLCGGSGSGKGTVAGLFKKYRVPTIDTDAIYHEIISKKSDCLDELVMEFGEEIINENGSLNRKKLAEIVFSQPSSNKASRLNEITHKYVLKEVRKIISSLAADNYPAVLVDAPMLFESGFDAECDVLVCVVADAEIRIARIMERDKISMEAAKARLAYQLSDEYLTRKCDYNIVNNSDFDALCVAVDDLSEKILD